MGALFAIIIVLAALLIVTSVLKISKKKLPKIVPILSFVCVGIILVLSAFTIVPTGYTGVRTTFGQVSQKIVPNGFNMKIPFVQSIELVNNKQQDITINGQVWGETTEKTPVYADDITITYQINTAKSAWVFANVTDARNLVSGNLVSSAIKSAMAELPASEVTVRSKIEPAVKEKLKDSIDEKYGADTVSILKIVVNQMDFEESYNAAIAEKSVALQKQAQQEIENKTAIDKAEADKKVAIANAEAEAEATRIKAEAEAKANEQLSKSMTDQIIKSKFYDKWDGKLPNVMGENTVVTDISK